MRDESPFGTIMKYFKRAGQVTMHFAFAAVAAALFMMITMDKVYAYEDIVVVIDPGHGGVVTEDNNNGGAIYNGVQEKDINLITAQALFNELSTYQNVTPYLTRTEDKELSLDERVAFARSVDAAVLVSVHYNASENHNFYGSEIFTSMYGAARATGYGMAQCIMKKWDSFGSPSKGIKTRQGNNGDYYGLIRKGCEIGMPVIILEHGYLDNDKDFTRMNSADKWQQLGVLDAAGIAEYYGFEKNVVKESITPTVSIRPLENPVLPDTTPPASVNFVVDSYDAASGEVKYSLSAAETEDTLMYYGIKAGTVTEDTVYESLELWDNSTGIQKGSFMAPAGFDGTLTARVYNTYELFTDSAAVDLGGLANGTGTDDEAIGAGQSGDEANGAPGADVTAGTSGADGDDGDAFNSSIRKEIVLNDSEAASKYEIPPEMVEDAANMTSLSSKSLLGLIVVGVVVGFALLVGVALLVIKLFDKADKRRAGGGSKRRNRKGRMYEWEDKTDEDGYYY